MVIAIIDSITTVEEVCLLQNHRMNFIDDAQVPPKQAFSDDSIAVTINNVIDFVYANISDDTDSSLIRFVVKTLAVIALNNIMYESGHLPNWERVDPFNQDYLQKLIQDKSSGIDSIPMISADNLVSDVKKKGMYYSTRGY